MRKRFVPHWGTALSSLLIVAAYPPWNLSWLIWISLVPWLIALSDRVTQDEKSYRNIFFAALMEGVWFSVGMNWLGFHWVGFVLHEFANVPWVVAGVGLGLYSLVGQAQFLVFSLLFAFFWIHFLESSKARSGSILKTLQLTLFLGLLYAGLDWWLPKIFKDTLGHALYSSSWIKQAAEIGGAHLLTFAVFTVNFTIFLLCLSYMKNREANRPVAIQALLCSLLLPLAFTGYGAWRLGDIEKRIAQATDFTQAAAIQANIGDFDKILAERGLTGASDRVVTDYLKLSDEALALQPKPDFLVWPETAYPSTYRHPMTATDLMREQRINSWVKSQRVPLLFGGYDHDGGKDFNALFVLTPEAIPSALYDPFHANGADLQFYRKNILLMFGEYIPFQDYFPAIGRAFPQVGNFGKGIGPDILHIPVTRDQDQTHYVKISPVICYEILFSNYVLQAANRGSQLILNITNDSWFGPYSEPNLHLALSVFRSIETRLPVFRATNTGFSAVILQNGEIASATQLFKPEILNYRIPLFSPPPTLMKRWGDWFGPSALVAGLCWALGSFLLGHHRHRNRQTHKD